MSTEAWQALAGEAGAHALPIFLALLALLLAATAAGWWAWHASVLPRVRALVPQPALVPLNALAGFALVVGAAMGFAEIAEQLGPEGVMARADEALGVAIGTHAGSATLQFFAAVTHLGDVATLTVLGVAVALLLAWRRHFALALGWTLALGGNGALNPLLKRVFERVRPEHQYLPAGAEGFSFPSGHTSGSTVAYGMLAYLAVRLLPPRWQLPAVLGAAALVFTIGCSRIFLRVHFASDVAAGFASGTAWLTVCIVSVELSRVYWGRGPRSSARP